VTVKRVFYYCNHCSCSTDWILVRFGLWLQCTLCWYTM